MNSIQGFIYLDQKKIINSFQVWYNQTEILKIKNKLLDKTLHKIVLLLV